VDKAQTRIFLLILIGLLFAGQAIYDYFKKRKISSQRKNAGPVRVPYKQYSKPNSHQSGTTPSLNVTPKDKNDCFLTSDLTGPEVLEKKQTVTMANSDRAKENNESMPDEQRNSDCMDLRKAMIWSEILKRKF